MLKVFVLLSASRIIFFFFQKYISKFEELVENSTLLLNGQKIVDKFDQIYKYIPKEKSSDDESEEDEIEKSKGKKYFQFFICLSKFIYNYVRN